ncbi:MAG: ABC transporter permease subunit [Oscillospiraceae bacterium]|nr:ABC transporter permease subunit [Oscillospiraceae bacterium]
MPITEKRFPISIRFSALLAGFVGIVACLFFDWVLVTNSARSALVIAGQGEFFNLFTFASQPESAAIQAFLTAFTVLSVAAVVMLLASLVLLLIRQFTISKLQTVLMNTGFSIIMALSLVFIIFAASVNDPAILKTTLVPPITFTIALIAMVCASKGSRDAVKHDWQLYILLLPAVALVFVFTYLPMYGIQIAFRDFKAAFGIAGSEWVGLKNFTDFFASYYSTRLILNTLLLNLYGLLWAFPFPIVMALFLYHLPWRRFKRFTQTVIYAPHFISPVVLVGILFLLLSPTTGLVNRLIESLGGTSISFMLEISWFRSIFIASDIWQHAGWNTILYIAALTAIDPALYEAAKIDGATKLQTIRHIDIPHMMPVIIMLLILNCGAMLASNTDKALLMQTDPNIPVSDIIGVYVYRMGIRGGQFSYTAAINLLVNVINFALILTVNWVARRTKQASLF